MRLSFSRVRIPIGQPNYSPTFKFKMKTKIIVLFCLFFVSIHPLFSQEEETQNEEGTLTLSGSLDTYFRTNLNAPNKGDNLQAPGSSFANLPGFSLGMANIIANYEGKKVGAVIDLVFG